MTTVQLSSPTTPPDILGVSILSPGIINDPALMSWTVPDTERVRLDANGRVQEVTPMAGKFGLIRHADSLGPVIEPQSGYPGMKFTNGQAHYLHTAQTFDATKWAIAMVVWGNGTDISNTRDVFGIFAGNRSYRVARTSGMWSVIEGANTNVLIAGDANIPTTATDNFRLIIIEYVLGVLRFRERSKLVVGTVKSLEGQSPQTVLGPNVSLVIGTDELPQTGGSPATARSWGHGIHDAIVMDNSILQNAARLRRIDNYFLKAYGQ